MSCDSGQSNLVVSHTHHGTVGPCSVYCSAWSSVCDYCPAYLSPTRGVSQQSDWQGYGAPYEQLRNQDLAEMANILMSENRGVNVADYPYDLPEDSVRPAAEEAANLPMFEGYGAPYKQLRNQDFAETAKIPNLPMFEMPEDNRFMQVDEQDEQNKGDMQRYGDYGGYKGNPGKPPFGRRPCPRWGK